MAEERVTLVWLFVCFTYWTPECQSQRHQATFPAGVNQYCSLGLNEVMPIYTGCRSVPFFFLSLLRGRNVQTIISQATHLNNVQIVTLNPQKPGSVKSVGAVPTLCAVVKKAS